MSTLYIKRLHTIGYPKRKLSCNGCGYLNQRWTLQMDREYSCCVFQPKITLKTIGNPGGITRPIILRNKQCFKSEVKVETKDNETKKLSLVETVERYDINIPRDCPTCINPKNNTRCRLLSIESKRCHLFSKNVPTIGGEFIRLPACKKAKKKPRGLEVV